MPQPLSFREQLLLLANICAKQRNHKSLKRLSTIIFNDGKCLDRVANDGDLTTGNFEKGMRWFSANWPENAIWPDSVARPTVSKADEAAA